MNITTTINGNRITATGTFGGKRRQVTGVIDATMSEAANHGHIAGRLANRNGIGGAAVLGAKTEARPGRVVFRLPNA